MKVRNDKIKQKMTMLLAILMIILGVIMIALPTISNYIISYLSSNTANMITNEITAKEITKNQNSEVNENTIFDFDSVEDFNPTTTLLNLDKINKDVIVGQISIPSIEMNLALLEGTNDKNLLSGATTMKANQVMGKGNYSLAGHYAKNGVLFGDLTKIKKNSIIRITDKTNIYEYKVFKTMSVSPNRIDLISDSESEKHGKAIVSLMNCYYVDGKNTGNRYFVFGELIDSYPYKKNKMINNNE